MDTADATARRELEAVRQRRAELGDTLDVLEAALAAAADLGPPLDRLTTEFALHVEVTEGEGGLHQAILGGDLRLANQVGALAAEHAVIAADIAAVVTAAAQAPPDPQAVRALVDRIVKHRERGAYLVYEAFQTDLGGGD